MLTIERGMFVASLLSFEELTMSTALANCFLHAQVNGKLRATIEMPKDVSKEGAVAAAQALPALAKHLDGKAVKKIIYVPSKILNLVVK